MVRFPNGRSSTFTLILTWIAVSCVNTAQASCQTEANETCVFPFKYQNVDYYGCVTVQSISHWCSIENDADGVTTKWGTCQESCLCDLDTKFTCNDGSCIPREQVCDSVDDCRDKSDEFCDRSVDSTSTTTASPGGRRKLECEIPKIGSKGTVQSPNFPSRYEDGFDCEWVIIADPETRVDLAFSNFKLDCESNAQCADFVEIRGANDREAPQKFCCGDKPENRVTNDNVVIVRLHTESNLSGQSRKAAGSRDSPLGFEFHWNQIRN